MIEYAEKYAQPYWLSISGNIPKKGNFSDTFYLRECQFFFNVFWGETWRCNVKVVVNLHYHDCVQTIVVDTDPYDVETFNHKRRTRNFFILPEPRNHGRLIIVRFAFIVHFDERSIPSQHSYHVCHGDVMANPRFEMKREVNTNDPSNLSPNYFLTYELDQGLLQRDADWSSHHLAEVQLRPVFTKGNVPSVYHPKHWIHQQIDWVIGRKRGDPQGEHTIKVCVDDIDDDDFVNHVIWAKDQGVNVQCIVDWRKMILTNRESYARLKRSSIELIGVACMPTDDPIIEVAPDMHTKFIIFDMEIALNGSFNFTFELWPSNWESGVIVSSQAVCRLLDNIFQSIRGGVIQKYGIDPLAPFNVLYTYGRHRTQDGQNYRPHRSIIHEIKRSTSSIKVVLFLMGEMIDGTDNIVDALIAAKDRGVNVQVMLNGHVVRVGPNDKPFSMADELKRPVVPAVARLHKAGVMVYLAYGQVDQKIPYCPIHSKYVVIDDRVVIDGSFNWYNTSVFSHDLVVVVRDQATARLYVDEFHQICREFRIWRGWEKVNFS